MGLDLTRVSLGTFRKPEIREVISIDGHVYAVLDPDQVQGHIDVAPVCEPKTDFDRYYLHNLAYFNLFAGVVYDEYLELCENEIRSQKLKSKAECVGREAFSNCMLAACAVPAAAWPIIALIRAFFNHMHGGN